ncbi:MAG TPA: succinate dehydrogenase, hydrophobic membrane anchor protein [Devosia sp.]
MIDKAAISNPKTRYGSARKATRLFRLQRITAALNLAFLLFFIWFVVSVAGQSPAGMIETIRNPFVALPLALLMVNVPIHMRIGMLEVIEDYADEDRTNRLFRTVNDVFAILVAVIAVGSIAKIVFWG